MDLKNRLVILQDIFGHFQSYTQWLPDNVNNLTQHYYQAEALIEILEIFDCGLIGGFDNLNPLLNVTGCSLYGRFLTLLRKHDQKKFIKASCGFTVTTLGNFFKNLSELRDKTIGQR